METSSHKDCYGAMFPSTLHAAAGRPMQGKVFAYELLTAGGTFRSDRKVSANTEAWDTCVLCQDFEACFGLSLGKLMLETAISEK